MKRELGRLIFVWGVKDIRTGIQLKMKSGGEFDGV